MRTVLIVVFDGVQSLDLTGPLEVLAAANEWCADQRRADQRSADRDAGPGPGGPAYRVETASLGGAAVRTSSGLRLLPDADLGSVPPPDLLIVPGGPGARRRDPALVAWLGAHARARPEGTGVVRLASVCTGAFLLAAAGLLDGRTVTTHWAHCAELAAQYPDVRVDPDPIFIRDGGLATSAGITAGIDLALALVEDDLGRDAALAVARALVVFLRRPGGQAQFSAQLAAQLAEREPLREVQRWIAEHPAADLSVEALARRASLSPRQFARAFTAQTGLPPGRYVDRTRLEAARRHLEDTTAGIEQTARACGYGTPEAMRRAFVRALGISPAEYTRRFRPGAHRQLTPPTPLATDEETYADRHRAL
jgi:transcriptional regulator GlxA family with amidase domain